MPIFKKTWVAGALAALMAATSAIPVSAAPLVVPQVHKQTDVETVQYRDRRGWYHGQRGYRYHRPGYRRHSDGWWYPLAAFGAGAVIGGAIAGSRPAEAGVNPRHYDWCASRYRTYRASDNTYVPRAGVRAECRSPYY